LGIQAGDFVTIGLLVALEGLLSADNALVMAIMVLGLPSRQHKQALRYGLLGGLAFRSLATLLAVYLIRLVWIKLAGGLYLLYLTWNHFHGQDAEERHAVPRAKGWLFLTAFWATVVRVELVNLAFSIDSILVAVAMSQKTWVVVIGGILGIIAMRLVVGQLITLVQRYPALVDGAFIIIAWVGIKLGLEYLHAAWDIGYAIPQWLSLTLIGVIFGIAFVYARMQGPAPAADPLNDQVERVLAEDPK